MLKKLEGARETHMMGTGSFPSVTASKCSVPQPATELARQSRSRLALSKAEIQQQARRFIKHQIQQRGAEVGQPRLQRTWCCLLCEVTCRRPPGTGPAS